MDGEGDGVGGRGVEEQRGDGSGDEQGGEGAGRDADEGQAEGFDEDAALDVGGGCAEGHADADLLRALGDGVGDDAVDAEGGERAPSAAKRRQGA